MKPLSELRRLLGVPDPDELHIIRERLENRARRIEDLSDVLPDAMDHRNRADSGIRRSLQSVIEETLQLSVRRNPGVIIDALYPIIGAMVRKSVAASLQALNESLTQAQEQMFSLRGLRWRFEAWRTGKPFAQIVLLRSALYRVEQVYLIHRKTGALLAHRVTDNGETKDPTLVSAMLTAIQDFARDSFGEDAESDIETMRMGTHTVWIEHGPKALLACLVRGTPPREFEAVMDQSNEQIHQNYSNALESFDGDNSEFGSAEPFLEACMLGHAPPNAKSRLKVWAALAGILLLGAVAWFAVTRWQEQRLWAQYVERLRTSAGLVVLSEEHSGGRYVVRGLRDPYSVDPARMRPTGLPQDRVAESWDEHHSAAFANRRQFDMFRSMLEQREIHFAIGRADIAPAALDLLADDVRILLRTAEAARLTVQVRVLGSTDPTGDDAFNSALALARSSKVAEELIARGLPGSMISSGKADLSSRKRGTWFRVQTR